MPVRKFNQARTQLEELAEYAIEHYTDLNMDRIDLLSKATGKKYNERNHTLEKGLEG